jgi:hypothetical protein
LYGYPQFNQSIKAHFNQQSPDVGSIGGIIGGRRKEHFRLGNFVPPPIRYDSDFIHSCAGKHRVKHRLQTQRMTTTVLLTGAFESASEQM